MRPISRRQRLLGTAVPSLPTSQISLCSWSFGDTSAASRFLSPTHLYANAGSYTATLSVTDSTGKTSTAAVAVTIGALPPLCQQPLIPSLSGLTPCAGPSCPSASFNNQCQPTCPLTTETLLPNQCPGPATGNQITINGPLQAQIDQPVTINASINLPGTSSLLPGDYLRFDFGDGAAITSVGPLALNLNPAAAPAAAGPSIPFAGNGGGPTQCADGTVSNSLGAGTCSDHAGIAGGTTGSSGAQVACYDQTVGSFIGPGTCSGHGGIAPGQPAPAGAAFPAPTQAMHAYTQPGTYVIQVAITFSDGTTAVAKTTATVAGASAALPTAPLSAPPVLATSVPLQSGCNDVTLTFPDGTPVSTVAAAIRGATLVAIYETPANAPQLAYYADPSATSNLASVQHGDAASICVQGSGTLVQPAT